MKERTKKAIEDLKRSWASNVIAALLCDFESGKANLPPDVVMKGINMVEKDNGTFVVGFVFAREGA